MIHHQKRCPTRLRSRTLTTSSPPGPRRKTRITRLTLLLLHMNSPLTHAFTVSGAVFRDSTPQVGASIPDASFVAPAHLGTTFIRTTDDFLFFLDTVSSLGGKPRCSSSMKNGLFMATHFAWTTITIDAFSIPQLASMLMHAPCVAARIAPASIWRQKIVYRLVPSSGRTRCSSDVAVTRAPWEPFSTTI